MSRFAKSMLVLCLVVPLVACDQATKALARNILAGGLPVDLLGGVVRLHLVENPGAFLSLGESLPDGVRLLLFAVLAPVGLVLLAVSLLRSRQTTLAGTCAVGLILAGGLGNLVDRVFNQGAVVDFVRVGIGRVQTGVFNLADVVLVAGVVLAVVSLRGSEEPGAGEGPGGGGDEVLESASAPR